MKMKQNDIRYSISCRYFICKCVLKQFELIGVKLYLLLQLFFCDTFDNRALSKLISLLGT